MLQKQKENHTKVNRIREALLCLNPKMSEIFVVFVHICCSFCVVPSRLYLTADFKMRKTRSYHNIVGVIDEGLAASSFNFITIMNH